MFDGGLEDEIEEFNLEQLDEVGQWSVRKINIVEYYASVYADITKAAKAALKRTYIDGFANRGRGRLKGTYQIVDGSALRILQMPHPFDRYIFIERNTDRMQDLKKAIGVRNDIEFHEGDANTILPKTVLPSVRYDQYERALCFLDPYNMSSLKWGTIAAAGANETIDAIIHFPTMDANRTVLLVDHGKIRQTMRDKMNEYWGDESWFEAAYSSDGQLPIEGLAPRKQENEALIEAFRKRLVIGAGFKYVSHGIPMRNSKGTIIYHLLVASHNKAAGRIIKAIEKRFIDEELR